ncbi:MAG: SH3 domain-containing protein [Alistipes sp.]|nr:SH3 domain-containing protein [Alistipes sp.]
MKRLFLLLILCGTLGAVNLFAQDLYKVTSNSGLNVRSAPNTNSTILGRLANGQLIEVDTFVGDWAEFQYNDKTAYVYSKYISKVESNAEGDTKTDIYEVINASYLNVRSQPTTQSSVIGSLAAGDRVEVISTTTYWAKIIYKGREAYASLKYLKKIEEEPLDEQRIPIDVTDTSEKRANTNNTTTKTNSTADSKPINGVSFRIVYSQPFKDNDVSSITYSLHYVHNIIGPLYGSLGLGIDHTLTSRYLGYNSYAAYDTIDSSTTALTIPLELGVRLPWDGNFALNLYTGPRFDILLGGKTKYKYGGEVIETIKINERIRKQDKDDENRIRRGSSSWVFGAAVNIYGFDLGCQFGLKMSQRDKIGNTADSWGVYIGWTALF